MSYSKGALAGLVAVSVSVLAMPLEASAGKPVIQRETDSYSAQLYCRGADLDLTVERDLVMQCMPQKHEFTIHTVWASTITNPINGMSVSDPGAWAQVFTGIAYPNDTCPADLNYVEGWPQTQIRRGSVYHMTVPGQGVVALDSGVIEIDTWTGEILFEAGPHDPSFVGVDICEILGANDCPAGTVENCWGGCTPASMVGDGTCEAGLDCPALGNDGGDCEPVTGCDGGTYPEWWLGDGICDIGLDCEAFDYDHGDCVCGPDEVEGCYGGCFPAYWSPDGYCDPDLNCEANNYDGGDCGT